MLNWLKWLRGRNSRIDDQTLAYIEGRADEAAGKRVREILAARPGPARADVEGMKATVSLLRAVRPVRAPRSFALSPAAADAARTGRPAGHRRGPWYMQAPAVAAAAAVLTVGVLVLGDIAGALRQSSGEQPAQLFESALSLKSAGPAGDPAVASGSAVAGDAFAIQATVAAAPEVQVPPDSAPAAVAPLAPVATQAVAEARAAATAATQPAQTAPQGVAVPAQAATPETTALPVTAGEFPVTDGGKGPPSSGTVTSDTAGIAGTEIMPIAATPGPEGASQYGEPAEVEALSGPELSAPKGTALPLWQTEVALAGAAALLIGLWAFLRRRVAA